MTDYDYIEKKILDGERLSEDELKMITWEEVGDFVEEIDNGSGRWASFVTTIFKLGDQYYALEWQRGLTEYQENEYMDQPYKVVRHEEQKVITEVTYKAMEE